MTEKVTGGSRQAYTPDANQSKGLPSKGVHTDVGI